MDIPEDPDIPQGVEGDEFMRLEITPKITTHPMSVVIIWPPKEDSP